MTAEESAGLADTEIRPSAQRRGDGGIFLVVADETPEFKIALRYATRRAAINRGHVAVLHIINIDDFQQWGSVEERMRRELREQAEKYIWNAAKDINELTGAMPMLVIAEGERAEVVLDLINKDENIRFLVLGGIVGSGGPGALISYFINKGLGRLRVPLVVVPGHLEPEQIDALA